MFSSCGPVAFRNDDHLRFLPCFNQTISILVMGKVTATRPPDHFDIRIRLLFTVMLIFAARIFQRIDDTGNRNRPHSAIISGLAGLSGNRRRHFRQHAANTCRVATIGVMIRETKTAARCTNLP
ncbi:Uncharacterised protein [Shigella sonnei]|nr:Uncharacterised protein [Shigella sonnei]CSP99864.1 Uncharacterised protein [Shigella sonnei]